MKYEFILKELFNAEQAESITMGLVPHADVEKKILDTLNEMGEEGWEPLTPFSMDRIWFKREKVDV